MRTFIFFYKKNDAKNDLNQNEPILFPYFYYKLLIAASILFFIYHQVAVLSLLKAFCINVLFEVLFQLVMNILNFA